MDYIETFLKDLMERYEMLLHRYSTDPVWAVRLICVLEYYCNHDFTLDFRSILGNWLKQQISSNIKKESNALLAYALYMCNRFLPDRSREPCKTLKAICRKKLKKTIFGREQLFRIDFYRIYGCMKSLSAPKTLLYYLYFEEEFEFFDLNFSSKELTYLLEMNDVEEPYTVSPSTFASKESPYLCFDTYPEDDNFESYVNRKNKGNRNRRKQKEIEIITIDDDIEVITIDDDTDTPSENCKGKDTSIASSKRQNSDINEETDTPSKKCKVENLSIASSSKIKNSDINEETDTPSKKCKVEDPSIALSLKRKNSDIDEETDTPSKKCKVEDPSIALSLKRKNSDIDEETDTPSKKCKVEDPSIASSSKRRNSDRDDDSTPSKKCKVEDPSIALSLKRKNSDIDEETEHRRKSAK